ncbi:hypothetical protein [Fulvivirga lutea]|uniref:Arabinogalactan endo-beta-1,4-galactanase n=1 Tax=Fulvivirga lutea TaxID=2810512 RepID=A0A974WIT5_9BACT|nr:hypothetical protein [Fulvivirga lutea]QSE97987.1 hypothetical protein JR347_02585 [Fulvivirga lutea]
MKNLTCTFLLLLISLLACDDDNSTETTIPDSVEPIEKGNREFGINMSNSVFGFEASFAEAQKAGIEVLELNIPWNAIETAEGVYQDPFGILQATSFYGANDIKVSFSLAVINTVQWEVPAYLESTAPDSPEFAQAFNNMVDWFVNEVPDNVEIHSISVGNEVDLVLNGAADWSAYTAFYQAAKNHISANYPSIKVGVKTTVAGGLFGAEQNKIVNINQFSDVIMLNYYPQNASFEVQDPESVFDDFERMVSFFPNDDIWITEIGYQSGEEFCKSSEAQQAEFYDQMFAAWDVYRDNISFLVINWLHDQSPEQINEWKEYYGDDPALVEYLSTLGLRNYDGTDKEAWLQVMKEANARGW